VIANAGTIASEVDQNISELIKEDPPTVTRATREDMLRETRADIVLYTRQREREFDGEHGYCLYPPVSSEVRDVDDDTDSEDGSTDELLPRLFPLVDRTRARRGAVSAGRSDRQEVQQSNRAADPNWFQNSIGAFAEYLDRRTEEGVAADGSGRQGASGSVEASMEGDDMTQDHVQPQEEDEDEVLYHLTYEALPNDEGVIMLYAGLDGIDWREVRDFIQRSNDFLAEWSPQFPDRPGEVPQRVRML
jgi:hypothetical protein